MLKVGKRFKYALPEMLKELSLEVQEFNSMRTDFSNSMSFRCVALAFNGNKLMSIGVNKLKTHPFTKNYHDQHHMSIHAEADMVMDLIKKNKIKKITDVVVIRGTANILSSRPCHICRGLLHMYMETTRVWWFDSDKNEWKVELA